MGIKLRNVRQKAGFCGPASLLSLVDFYGTRATQPYLADICHTTAKDGTSPENIIKGLKKLGFRPKAGQNGSVSSISRLVSRGTPVLVNWWSDFEEPADGHYSVIFKSTPHFLFMMDPELGGVRKISKVRFDRQWYDYYADGRKNTRWCLHLSSLTSGS